jgi:hypothetical protein
VINAGHERPSNRNAAFLCTEGSCGAGAAEDAGNG